MMTLTPQSMVKLGSLEPRDHDQIKECRGQHNKLGFCYQLLFVKIMNKFPTQIPFEMRDDILTFASLQINIPAQEIKPYQKRQATISEHQTKIKCYLGLQKFDEVSAELIDSFIFTEASKLDDLSSILSRTEQYLREQNILFPAEDTLRRRAILQREKARQWIYSSMAKQLTPDTIQTLNSLLMAGDTKYSKLQKIKMPPLNPSVEGISRLTEKLDMIESTGVISLDLSWLNNNYQRTLAKYAQRYSAFRLKETEASKRHAILVCFLCQAYRETVDYLADTYFKLMTRIYNKAGKQQDKANKKQSKKNRTSLVMFDTVSGIVLDSRIPDADVRQHIFRAIPQKVFANQSVENKKWLTGKHSHLFKSVISRFNYLRQFAPEVLSHLQFKDEGQSHTNSHLLNAINTLKDINESRKRKLPIDTPVNFIPKKIRALIKGKNGIERHGWECAVLTAIRDEVKAGNLSVDLSKRFGQFNDFFMPYSEWEKKRGSFYQRSKMPKNPQEVPQYLTTRLNKAMDQFIELETVNEYAKVEEDKWVLSVDEAEKLSVEDQGKLDQLKDWLSSHMRTIKLADLLVEVDNDLHLTSDFFMSSDSEKTSNIIEDIGSIIAIWMAHGCFIGTKTMARLIKDVSYSQIKNVTDWQLSDEAQRGALARTVNAITALEVSESWGDGSSSSSDNENYAFKEKVLQRSYSPKFGDFALEFYMFIANNYAPFYSMPIEVAHRDSPYVLDGVLYNESDLPLEDHYVDTHGYMEINFTAFAMLGRRLNPRIKNVKHQRIYRIDTTKDYKSLTPLVRKNNIHMDWIVEQWDRMGQFYASFESGHTTASVAMKRLASFTGKNHFYRANREFGRIIKTENILNHMCDPILRRKRQRGLLKGEQMHQLARNIAYGKRGKISARDLHMQKITCNCLTLIMACIIYWQSKEIMRVIKECHPELAGIDLRMLEHISPAEWDNLILYGEYVIKKDLIRR